MCMKMGIIIKSLHHPKSPLGDALLSPTGRGEIRKKSVPPFGGTDFLIGGGWEGLSIILGGGEFRLGPEAQVEEVVGEYR